MPPNAPKYPVALGTGPSWSGKKYSAADRVVAADSKSDIRFVALPSEWIEIRNENEIENEEIDDETGRGPIPHAGPVRSGRRPVARRPSGQRWASLGRTGSATGVLRGARPMPAGPAWAGATGRRF
ncbi:hypothetical protein GCM10022245_03220 [Streptomyces mayteni]